MSHCDISMLTQCVQHLLREVRVWQRLHHPNIAPLCGYMWEEQIESTMSASLVSPYHPEGEVADYLSQHPTIDRLQLVSLMPLPFWSPLITISIVPWHCGRTTLPPQLWSNNHSWGFEGCKILVYNLLINADRFSSLIYWSMVAGTLWYVTLGYHRSWICGLQGSLHRISVEHFVTLLRNS